MVYVINGLKITFVRKEMRLWIRSPCRECAQNHVMSASDNQCNRLVHYLISFYSFYDSKFESLGFLESLYQTVNPKTRFMS